jgi:hypothetical protein
VARRPIAGTCILCGQYSDDLSKEDVIPKWMRKVLPVSGPVQYVNISKDVVYSTDATMVLTLRGAVCHKCNNEPLSQLEELVKPLVSNAIGKPGTIEAWSPDSQRIIATWAVKEALLIELACKHMRGDGYAPQSHFAWLYEALSRKDPSPPPGSWVFLGALDPDGLPAWNSAGVFGDKLKHPETQVAQPIRTDDIEPSAYVAQFSFGCLLFAVFGQDFKVGQRPTEYLAAGGLRLGQFQPPSRFGRHLVTIWPYFHPVIAWPPAARLTVGKLNDFADWRDARRIVRVPILRV